MIHVTAKVTDGSLVPHEDLQFRNELRKLEGHDVEIIIRSVRIRSNPQNRYYWGTRKTVTGSAGQNIVFDISLPSDNAFCTEELTIDYDITSISGSPLTALADGSSTITITVQERDQFGEARSENSGVLALTAAPSAGVSITNIQSMGDGTYTALVSSNKVQSVTISGTIDDNPLGGNVTLSFTPVQPS